MYVKRLFDILFSLCFLTVFSPLIALIALLVRCSGPVFYRSRRVGMGGRVIWILKFRTMCVDAEERLQELLQSNGEEWRRFQKLKNDPRITPMGRFLRRTSLDELPQFWNVLRGDLSVVGPRPPTIVGDNPMEEIAQLYGHETREILSVRPGITGLWQISGRSQIPFALRKRLERRYVVTRSFWTDLIVIAKTVPAVLFSKGAC